MNIKTIEEVMQLGYDINIECKGKGRGFEMTYEATAHRVMREDEDYRAYLLDTYGSFFHAVGNTLDELGEKLLTQVRNRQSVDPHNLIL